MMQIGIKHRSVDYALNAPHYTRRNMAAAGWRRASPAERSVGVAWAPKASSVASMKYAGMCIMSTTPGIIQEMPTVPKLPPPPLEHAHSEPSEPSDCDFDVRSSDPDDPEGASDDPEEQAPLQMWQQWQQEVLKQVHMLKLGRGATDRITNNKENMCKRVVKELYYIAEQHGVRELSDVLTALQAETSTIRDHVVQDWNERDTKPGQSYSRQKLESLKLIMKACCDWRTVVPKHCPGMVALGIEIAKKYRAYVVTTKNKRARYAVTEQQALFTQGGVALPKDVLMPTEPSWMDRAALHQQLLPEVLRELEERLQTGQSLKSSSRPNLRLTDSDTLLQFKCFFLMSESVPCQRKTPWQTTTWAATPPAPFATDGTGTLDAELVNSLPTYLVYHPEHKLYGLTQWHTKIGMCLWLPLPAAIQSLVMLYLQLLARAYDASPTVRLPEREGEMALFPSERGTFKADETFRTWEKQGFSDIGLQGATVFNARHALTRHLILQGVTPTSSHADLADSFCAAMQTSTRHVFGEKIPRQWGLAPYNMALEASGCRRAEAALMKYTEWLFVKPRKKRGRSAAAASPAKKK